MRPGLLVEQGDAERYRHGFLVGLARRRRHRLGQLERRDIAIMRKSGRNLWGARLRVPQTELLQIEPRAVFHCADKVLAGGGFAIVTLEIKIGPAAEGLFARHGAHHADHLGALVVDRRSVEIADFAVGIGADWMCQRSRILGKLHTAQDPDILDPLDRLAAHVSAEQLVAQHREAFLEAQLEPVAAGYPIARPIVEILVADHPLDAVVVAVGRGFGVGQHVFGVEDVEALVLHRPHVEIGDGNDVEQVEIVFTAEDLFVPLHRALQALHCMFGPVEIAIAHIDVQFDVAPPHGGKAVAARHEIACDQREEIGWLGPGIVPFGPMALAIGAVPAIHAIAIAQQDRELRFRTTHADAVGAQHVGPIREEGDPAETFCLALRAQHPARRVEAH